MPKKMKRLLLLAILSAGMVFATGCGNGSTGNEDASAPENDEDAGADNVAQSEEDAGSGADAGSDAKATAEAGAAADAAGSTGAGKAENLDALVGEWVKIAAMGEGYYGFVK